MSSEWTVTMKNITCILKIYILNFVGENRKLSESLPSNLCKSLSDWKRRTKAKTTQQTEITSKR